jgi:hypothetical protein
LNENFRESNVIVNLISILVLECLFAILLISGDEGALLIEVIDSDLSGVFLWN